MSACTGYLTRLLPRAMIYLAYNTTVDSDDEDK